MRHCAQATCLAGVARGHILAKGHIVGGTVVRRQVFVGIGQGDLLAHGDMRQSWVISEGVLMNRQPEARSAVEQAA